MSFPSSSLTNKLKRKRVQTPKTFVVNMDSSMEPVLFYRQNSEEKLLSSSPASTAELHMHMDVCNNSLECQSVDRLASNISEINFTSSSSLLGSKKNKALLRTIHNSDIKILKPIQMVMDLKFQLCQGTMIDKDDIRIIKDGKELSNSASLCQNDLINSKVYVLFKTSCKTSIPISLKVLGDSTAKLRTLKIPVNMKVFALKKQLFSNKFTKIRPECQRIIVGGKVLNDCFIIGDYLLSAIVNKSSSRSHGSLGIIQSAAGAPAVAGVEPLTTMYLSQTTNTKHEVKMQVSTGSGVTFNADIGLTQPLSYLTLALNKMHRVPLPNGTFDYSYILRVPLREAECTSSPFFAAAKCAASSAGTGTQSTTTSSSSSSAAASQKKAKMSTAVTEDAFIGIELDQTKSLLDYGFNSDTKTLSVSVAREHTKPSIANSAVGMVPSSSSSLSSGGQRHKSSSLKQQLQQIQFPQPSPLFAQATLMYCALAANQRVKRMTEEGWSEERAAAEVMPPVTLTLPSSTQTPGTAATSATSSTGASGSGNVVAAPPVVNADGSVTHSLALNLQQLAELMQTGGVGRAGHLVSGPTSQQSGSQSSTIGALPSSLSALLASASAASSAQNKLSNGLPLTFDEFAQMQTLLKTTGGSLQATAKGTAPRNASLSPKVSKKRPVSHDSSTTTVAVAAVGKKKTEGCVSGATTTAAATGGASDGVSVPAKKTTPSGTSTKKSSGGLFGGMKKGFLGGSKK